MKKEFTGNPGVIGEKQCWDSTDKHLGKGCITLTKTDAISFRTEADMKFITPYESEAKEYVQLTSENGETKATWGFNSEIPYPWTVMKLLFDMEDTIGPDYQAGLEKLKKISEK